jgi:hypothetical protein
VQKNRKTRVRKHFIRCGIRIGAKYIQKDIKAAAMFIIPIKFGLRLQRIMANFNPWINLDGKNVSGGTQ